MIGKYLDISTAHLTPETIDNLVMQNVKDVTSFDYPEGQFIVVPDRFSNALDVPRDLMKVFNYAKEQGISLIRVDRDGEEISELPTYEWESTSKEEFLKQPAEVQQQALMETAMRIQEVADYLRYTGAISTISYGKMELANIYTEMARDFEYRYYNTVGYSDDYINFTEKIFTEKLTDKFGKENK